MWGELELGELIQIERTGADIRSDDSDENERAAKEGLALPMFPELTEDEQRWVVASVAEFYR